MYNVEAGNCNQLGEKGNRTMPNKERMENNTTNMQTFQIGLFSFNLLRNVDDAGKVECILEFHSYKACERRVDGMFQVEDTLRKLCVLNKPFCVSHSSTVSTYKKGKKSQQRCASANHIGSNDRARIHLNFLYCDKWPFEYSIIMNVDKTVIKWIINRFRW